MLKKKIQDLKFKKGVKFGKPIDGVDNFSISMSSFEKLRHIPRCVFIVLSPSGVTMIILEPVGPCPWTKAGITPNFCVCFIYKAPNSSLPILPVIKEGIPNAEQANKVLGADPPGW